MFDAALFFMPHVLKFEKHPRKLYNMDTQNNGLEKVTPLNYGYV